MPAVDLIRERLQTLDPLVLEIGDESHLHKGHAGNTGARGQYRRRTLCRFGRQRPF